jgi:hypothetical protein
MTERTALRDADHARQILSDAGLRERFDELGSVLSDEDASAPFSVVALRSGPLSLADAIVAWQRVERLGASTRISAVLVEVDAWENLRPDPRALQPLPDPAALLDARLSAMGELSSLETATAVVRERVDALCARLKGGFADLAKLDSEQLAQWESGELDDPEVLYAPSTEDEDEDEQDPEPRSLAPSPTDALMKLAPSPYSPSVREREVLLSFGGRRGRVHLVVLGCESWEALAVLGFGAFNDCPLPDEHAALWKRFAERYGARPLLLGAATIDAVVSRPPTTPDALCALVAEQIAYAPESVSEGVLAHAWALYDCGGWGFWWD